MERKKILRKKTSKKHIVVFQDFHQKVLKTVFVDDGDKAQAPEMDEVIEEKTHTRILFDGWDQNISCVHSNLVVCPLSKEVPKIYLIMYFHEDGKILGTETVPYGESAKAEIYPVKPETEEYIYHFDGWNCDLHAIDRDCMAKAMFRAERKRFRVRFWDADDQLIKEELIFYGFSANPPKKVTKSDDKTFRYYFLGWDHDFSTVKTDLNVYPQFREEFINYKVQFCEEGILIEERDYHYHDEIIYPCFHKRGYDYIWNDSPKLVTESLRLDGRWEYSNTKGKQIEVENGIYEITNPSVNHGEAKCVRFFSTDEIVTIPSRVKLGDYFYSVTSIGTYSLSSCPDMKKLVCPNSIRFLEDKCFAKNKKLQEIILGENIISMGKYIFMDCGHLKKISINSNKLQKIHKESFEKMNRRVCLDIPDLLKEKYKKLIFNRIRNKEMLVL